MIVYYASILLVPGRYIMVRVWAACFFIAFLINNQLADYTDAHLKTRLSANQ